jgi:hypothetical protein
LKAETQSRSAKSFRSLGRKYKVHHASVKTHGCSPTCKTIGFKADRKAAKDH